MTFEWEKNEGESFFFSSLIHIKKYIIFKILTIQKFRFNRETMSKNLKQESNDNSVKYFEMPNPIWWFVSLFLLSYFSVIFYFLYSFWELFYVINLIYLDTCLSTKLDSFWKVRIFWRLFNISTKGLSNYCSIYVSIFRDLNYLYKINVCYYKHISK